MILVMTKDCEERRLRQREENEPSNDQQRKRCKELVADSPLARVARAH